MSFNQIGIKERMTQALNEIDECDRYGNQKRLWGQLLVFGLGEFLTLSKDPQHVRFGMAMQSAAATSFGQLIGAKITRWLQAQA